MRIFFSVLTFFQAHQSCTQKCNTLPKANTRREKHWAEKNTTTLQKLQSFVSTSLSAFGKGRSPNHFHETRSKNEFRVQLGQMKVKPMIFLMTLPATVGQATLIGRDMMLACVCVCVCVCVWCLHNICWGVIAPEAYSRPSSSEPEALTRGSVPAVMCSSHEFTCNVFITRGSLPVMCSSHEAVYLL